MQPCDWRACVRDRDLASLEVAVNPTRSLSGTPRVAVVGVGRWGRNLARNFHALGALQALCDTDADIRNELAAVYPDIPVYSSVEALHRQEGLDGVVVATPAGTHSPVGEGAIRAGAHLFVEKPMATRVERAHAVAELAQAHDKIVFVGHILQYHPAFQELRSRVDAGSLGTLTEIEAERVSTTPPEIEEDALWEYAPHDVSMVMRLADSVGLETIECDIERTDSGRALSARARLGFAGGLVATVRSATHGSRKVQCLVVNGTAGRAVFDDVAPHPAKLSLSLGEQSEGQAVAVAGGEPLAIECAAFLEAIATGEPPLTGAAEGIRVVAILEACEQASREGQTVGAPAEAR